MLLLTANRRMAGLDSLEQTIREEGTLDSLPVLTVGDVESLNASGRVGNLAYVLSRERIQVTREGVTECLAARATNVFRREAGTWRMTYRHAEAPRHENVEVARLLRGGVAEEMYGRHATARPRRGD
jgi:hypothetical protein